MRSTIQKQVFLKILLVFLAITTLFIFWGTVVNKYGLRYLISDTYTMVFMNLGFRTACKNLTGKELTLSNINSLSSRLTCYSLQGKYSKCDDVFLKETEGKGFAVYPYPGVTQWGCRIYQKDNKITVQTLSPG